MSYAMPANATNFVGMMTYINDTTSGIFGIILLITIFLIAFISMRSRMPEYAGQNVKIFTASAFASTVICVMLFIIGLVNDVVLISCIFLTALGVFGNMISGDR